MENLIINLVASFVGVAVGAGALLMIFKGNQINIKKKKITAEELIEESKKNSDKILLETKEGVEKAKKTMEEENERRGERMLKIEESLRQREENLEKKEERVSEIKIKIAAEKEEIQALEEQVKKNENRIIEKLSEKTGASTGVLKEKILKENEKELEKENLKKLSSLEENYRENSTKIAKKIIINVLQRICTETSVETRAIHILVPKDHIKGKIVGKDAGNVKIIEDELDVDIIFNDLPNTISISAFNLVNRRIAQATIEKLVKKKGDIDKNTVKRTIKEAEQEVDSELYKQGKEAIEKIGLKEKNKNLTKLIGRLRYRTSYGQNIMKHSMEVAWVASMLGNELGLNVKTCLTGGFLHDLGKAVDQDPNITDPHDLLSKKIMEENGFSWEEVHAAWTHHDSEQQQTPEALIVKAADAISAGRPGARQESIEKYVERLQALEKTVKSFDGIKNTYAISAGREIRVIVDPQKHSDESIKELAGKVAKKIETDLKYPGKIKVNVIRRTKTIEIAK